MPPPFPPSVPLPASRRVRPAAPSRILLGMLFQVLGGPVWNVTWRVGSGTGEGRPFDTAALGLCPPPPNNPELGLRREL